LIKLCHWPKWEAALWEDREVINLLEKLDLGCANA